MRELNFDGLVGPTHQYGGLSPGNLASERHEGRPSNPREAALQGIAKMRFLASLGVAQAVLPPHARPDVRTLRRLGFSGSDADVLTAAGRGDGHLLRLAASASSMWTANAATVAPACDTVDGRTHVVVANLSSLFHRSLEAETTHAVLRSVFADEDRFAVHGPLPGVAQFGDEGAANHLRLSTSRGTVHVLGWGREAWGAAEAEARFPRRQTREASEAVARLLSLREGLALPWQQDPAGVDEGAFHSDVLAVGNDGFLLMHEHAFVHHRDFVERLEKLLGPELTVVVARSAELPLADAVAAYPFNSQLVSLPSGRMAIVAPAESRESAAARAFLSRVEQEPNVVEAVHYVDVNASMNNGGGPACLRLRVALGDEDRSRLRGRVVADDRLFSELEAWVRSHYRDRLVARDLADPALLTEVRTALDELTRVLELGAIYDFQKG